MVVMAINTDDSRWLSLEVEQINVAHKDTSHCKKKLTGIIKSRQMITVKMKIRSPYTLITLK